MSGVVIRRSPFFSLQPFQSNLAHQPVKGASTVPGHGANDVRAGHPARHHCFDRSSGFFVNASCTTSGFPALLFKPSLSHCLCSPRLSFFDEAGSLRSRFQIIEAPKQLFGLIFEVAQPNIAIGTQQSPNRSGFVFVIHMQNASGRGRLSANGANATLFSKQGFVIVGGHAILRDERPDTVIGLVPFGPPLLGDPLFPVGVQLRPASAVLALALGVLRVRPTQPFFVTVAAQAPRRLNGRPLLKVLVIARVPRGPRRLRLSSRASGGAAPRTRPCTSRRSRRATRGSRSPRSGPSPRRPRRPPRGP